MKRITLLSLFLCLIATLFVAAQGPVIPVSASTSFNPEFGTDLNNTINGNGLASFPSLTADHDPTSPGNSFVGTGTSGVYDYDLGDLYTIQGMSFWNQNDGGPGPAGITGVQDVTIQSSTDGGSYTNIPGAPTVIAQVATGVSAPETFLWTPVDAAFIRIIVDSNWGDTNTGYGEIAFDGELALSIEDNSLDTGLSIYPNPARDQVHISNQTSIDLQRVLIYDVTGQLVKTVALNGRAHNTSINISDLSSGIYMVKVLTSNSSTLKKLVKL